ncbi:response regulator transcription factor [Culicoidibacter larvae]|uniref:Response regulator transcription factor n=1 Tax=Culicoidibacter larvae TaxID=2579976 RepID=A0A5R8Q894_9FIRM|nr:response regulator transcription factor [Culicoidibacter larvae]TLG70274.1 response regulator transcription factor [Culicoidibacter larvae]
MCIKKHILFIDDDDQYQRVVKSLLVTEGYEVTTASNAAVGIELFQKHKYDLVLSDLMMESVDGLQLLSFIRRIDPSMKVIILTGSDELAPEIRGLQLLANDFIRKPVDFDILLARIARVLIDEEKHTVHELVSEREQLVVHLDSRQVMKADERIELTVKEFDLLVYFLRNRNVVHSREQLLKEVWRMDINLIDIRSVDTLVKKVRRKLHISSIYSMRGVGYEWIE